MKHDNRTIACILVAAASFVPVLVFAAEAVTLSDTDKLKVARALNGALVAERNLLSYRAMSRTITPAQLLELEERVEASRADFVRIVGEVKKSANVPDGCDIEPFSQEVKCASK